MYLQKFRKIIFVWAIHHEKLSTALLLFIAFALGGAIYFIILNVTVKHTDSRHLRYELMPVLFSFQMPSESKPPSYWFTIETPQGQNAQIGTRSLVKAQQVTDTACVDIRKRTLKRPDFNLRQGKGGARRNLSMLWAFRQKLVIQVYGGTL